MPSSVLSTALMTRGSRHELALLDGVQLDCAAWSDHGMAEAEALLWMGGRASSGSVAQTVAEAEALRLRGGT